MKCNGKTWGKVEVGRPEWDGAQVCWQGDRPLAPGETDHQSTGWWCHVRGPGTVQRSDPSSSGRGRLRRQGTGNDREEIPREVVGGHDGARRFGRHRHGRHVRPGRRAVRFRRRGYVPGRLGRGQSSRARSLHGAQRARCLLRRLALRFRSLRSLHMA